MLFFTADQHFGHRAIIEYCNRPFASVEQMDLEMIYKWNSVVGPKDTVYHLGDFTLGNRKVARRYFSQLNGFIRVLANKFHHDKRWLQDVTNYGYESIQGNLVVSLPPVHVLEIDLGNPHPQTIVLSHFPFAVWEKKHFGAWHLHGHSHGRYHAPGKILDVGVDCNDFTPVSLDEVRRRFEE